MKNQNNGSPVVGQIIAGVYLAACTWMFVEAVRFFKAARKKEDAVTKLIESEIAEKNAESNKKVGVA